MSFQRKVLRSDRGTVFLETAIVAPIFLILLAFCVDIPRILVVRQRLGGAGRLTADIRARKGGKRGVNEEAIQRYFFADDFGDSVPAGRIAFPEVKDEQNPVSRALAKENFGIRGKAGSILGKIVNVLTSGGINRYVVNVFKEDVFYAGQVTAEFKPILPPHFYSAVLDMELTEDGYLELSSRYTCYMPGAHSSQKPEGRSFFARIGGWLP